MSLRKIVVFIIASNLLVLRGMKCYSLDFTSICRLMETLSHHAGGNLVFIYVRESAQPHATRDSLHFTRPGHEKGMGMSGIIGKYICFPLGTTVALVHVFDG